MSNAVEFWKESQLTVIADELVVWYKSIRRIKDDTKDMGLRKRKNWVYICQNGDNYEESLEGKMQMPFLDLCLSCLLDSKCYAQQDFSSLFIQINIGWAPTVS